MPSERTFSRWRLHQTALGASLGDKVANRMLSRPYRAQGYLPA